MGGQRRGLRAAWLIALCACGRFGFDEGGTDPSGDGGTQGDGAQGTPDGSSALTTLWLFGGSDGNTTQGQVWRSTDGVSWAQAGTLPAPRSRGAVYYVGGTLIFAGGAMGLGTAFGEVWQSSDGATWNQIGTLPLALAGMAYGVFAGQLWVIGGETAGGASVDVVRASVDGVTWPIVGYLPYPVHGGVLVAHGGRMYLVAGHNGAFLTSVISSADGITWTAEPSIPTAREYHGVAIFQDRLTFAGGTPSANDVRALSGGSWMQLGALPAVADHAFLANYNGRMWVLSGAAADVLSSADGSSWVDEGNLPGPRSYFNALVTPAL